MKKTTKRILVSLLSVMLVFSMGLFVNANVSFADTGYLYNSDPASVTTYRGDSVTSDTNKALPTTEHTPDSTTNGSSFKFTNENMGGSETFSFVSANKYETVGENAYNAIKFVAYFSDPMTSWTFQLGAFNSSEALNGGEKFINGNIMDSAGYRWENSANKSSDIKAGWNEITLVVSDKQGGGFVKNSEKWNSKDSRVVDSFAIRAHSGSTPFEVEIYSVEMITVEADAASSVVTHVPSTYLYEGAKGTKVTAYQGTSKADVPVSNDAPEGTGLSYVYSNTNGAGVTRAYATNRVFKITGSETPAEGEYNAVKITAYFSDPMDSWTLQFGLFSTGETLNENGTLKGDNIMDEAGYRWEKSSNKKSDIKAGWNVITLSIQGTQGGGFVKNSEKWKSEHRYADAFAVRAHSGSTPFEIKIYSVELTNVSEIVKPGVLMYGEDKVKDVAMELGEETNSTHNNTEIKEATDGEDTFRAYYVNGSGGFWSTINLADTYDLSAINFIGKGAFAFRFYIQDEATFAAYKNVGSWNIDVCSSETYSDAHKISLNIAPAFKMCKVGWNSVIVPFSVGTKEGIDWKTVNNIRLNSTGSGLSVATWIAIGDFQAILTDVTEITVEGYVPPVPEEEKKNERVNCSVDTGLHVEAFDEKFGDGQVVSTEGFYKEGKGALKFEGQGTAGSGKKFAKELNLTGYDAISFWLYVDSAANFTAMADGELEMTSAGGRDDSNEYSWKLKTLTLKDGWNYVVLPLEGAKKGEPNLATINYINIYFVGLPQITVAIFDDMHAHKTEGTVIESFDNGFTTFVELVEGKVGSATNMSGQGWVSRKPYENTIDIADADKITLWVYCGDAESARHVGGTELEISSSGTCDQKELTFNFPKDLKEGWNYVVFDIKSAKHTGGDCDLTAVNFVGVVKIGLPQITVYFDDLRAIESKFVLEDETAAIEKEIILNCDKVTDGVFDGLTLDYANAKEGYASLTTNGQNKDEVLTATFNPVKTGLSLDGKDELGYAFWLYVENASQLRTLNVELSSSKNPDQFELEWAIDVNGLENGWNWITLYASDAQRVGGVIDVDAIVRTRITAFSKENTPSILLKFDCFQIVNTGIEGAFDKVENKVVLNPVFSVDANNCDTAWTNSTADETNKKQGFASVSVTNNGEATVTATGAVNTGKTDLMIIDVPGNRLGLSFWMYVKEIAAIDQISIKLTAGSGTITWKLVELSNGWNWVVLNVKDATIEGNVDTDNITAIDLTVSAKANEEEGYQNFVVNIDRVKVINVTIENNHTEPADESQSRDYVKELVIIDCNTVSGTTFSGNTVDKADFRYGNGAVMTSGAGYQLTATDLEVGKTDLTKDTIVLAFWVWIEDPTYYNAEGVNAQVELASNNSFDQNEIYWSFEKIAKNLEQGWNWVVFKGSDAAVAGGLPNFDELCRFRLYVNNITQSTMKVDRITIGYVGNTALFTAPDWQKEIDANGTFKGPNGSMSKNDVFLEVDFEEAEGFVTVEEGCSSAAGAECAVLGLALVAVAALLKKKKNA